MNGDPNMAEFLQRVCGYTLFPYNKEECFFIFYGATTRNGKSTLLESIKLALGDYAKAVSSATLSERPTGKEANPEIISLVGAKLIICGELNSETLLNDTLLKSWIGNDTISARNLFSNDILNFKIDGKLYANCNELPPMKNDDLLNSNRIIVIPFDRHFEEHEQNKNLKKLFATSEFKAVIMAWLVEGYKRYLQLGIKANMPERVKQAIENYQSEANSINVFLSDEDVFERIDVRNYEDAVKVTDKRLYSAYVDWCKDNNCRALSSANFKKQLRKNRHYENDKVRDGVRYTKILTSYKLRPALTVTDMSQVNNPDKLVTLSQRELDRLTKK
jgi:putative DNA primase/helicase